MRKIKTIPFEAAHFDLMELRGLEQQTIGTNRSKYEALAAAGTCGTMICDGRVLGVIGYYEFLPGNYEVFILPSVYIAEYAIMFAKTVRAWLSSVAKSHPVQRFQTSCVDDDLHNRWMEFIGFKCETPNGMPNYVQGLTYKLWSRMV